MQSLANHLQLILRLSFQILQRRYFHPLRSVPGPWSNSVSELPAALALVRGNQHVYYRSLHEKYGPVVRVSPGELSFISVEAREEIYGLRVRGLVLSLETHAADLEASCTERWPQHGEKPNISRRCWRCRWADRRQSRPKQRTCPPTPGIGIPVTNSALVHLEDLAQAQIHKFTTKLKTMAAKNQP